MTATLVDSGYTKRVVLDGEIVAGNGIDFGPLPDGKAWIDSRAGSGAGVGGFPASYYLALENATGTLAGTKIDDLNTIPGTLDTNKLSTIDFTGMGDGAFDGLQVVGGQVDLSGANYPYLFMDSGALTIPYLDADKLDAQEGAYYLSLANATGTLATSKGGTGADGSSLAAGLVLASPSGGSGGAGYRALAATDIPSLDAAKITSGAFAKAQQHAQTAYLDGASGQAFANRTVFSGGLEVTGGSGSTGRVWKDVTDGMVLRGVAGSTNSFRVVNELNQTIFAVPVGTQAASFPGNLSTGGTLGVTGVATFTTSAGFSGLITANLGLAIAGGSSGSGRLWSDATAGLAARGITGSTYCFELRNDANAAALRVPAGSTQVQALGNLYVASEIEIDGVLNHDGASIGFYGVTPVARPAAYTQAYATASRTHAARTAAALTDNAAGTVGTTLAAIANPADSPATADALRDDLVANALPAIRNAISSLADQINKLRTDDLSTAQVLNSALDDLQANGTLQ